MVYIIMEKVISIKVISEYEDVDGKGVWGYNLGITRSSSVAKSCGVSCRVGA